MKPYCPRRVVCVENGHINRPVFGLDIDGTLGDYYLHFLMFAQSWLGKQIESGYTGQIPLATWMGVSKSTYRQVKLAYRRGGLKRSMPAYSGASELTRSLRKRGAMIVLCTTRPYLQLENIEIDTVEWTRRNAIQYDSIISGERKYQDLAHLGVGRIVAVLDDLPEMLRQAYEANLPAILRSQPHNAHLKWTSSVVDLDEASELLHGKLTAWEGVNR